MSPLNVEFGVVNTGDVGINMPEVVRRLGNKWFRNLLTVTRETVALSTQQQTYALRRTKNLIWSSLPPAKVDEILGNDAF